jgi:hypothetical protein
MKTLISAAALSFMLIGPAFAFQCPADVAKIDAAIAGSSLSDADKAKAMELRNAGESLHSGGQQQESVDTLAKAKEMLGID